MQVEKDAVQDLLRTIPWSSTGMKWVVEILGQILPEIEAGDEKAAIETAVRVAKNRPDYDPESLAFMTLKKLVRRCIHELDYHTDKIALLRAAIMIVNDVRLAEECLYESQHKIQSIFQDLDERTKAILSVYRELSQIDGVTNPPTNYGSLIDNLETVDIDVLREEPDLAFLMEAHDKARSMNEIL